MELLEIQQEIHNRKMEIMDAIHQQDMIIVENEGYKEELVKTAQKHQRSLKARYEELDSLAKEIFK